MKQLSLFSLFVVTFFLSVPVQAKPYHSNSGEIIISDLGSWTLDEEEYTEGYVVVSFKNAQNDNVRITLQDLPEDMLNNYERTISAVEQGFRYAGSEIVTTQPSSFMDGAGYVTYSVNSAYYEETGMLYYHTALWGIINQKLYVVAYATSEPDTDTHVEWMNLVENIQFK